MAFSLVERLRRVEGRRGRGASSTRSTPATPTSRRRSPRTARSPTASSYYDELTDGRQARAHRPHQRARRAALAAHRHRPGVMMTDATTELGAARTTADAGRRAAARAVAARPARACARRRRGRSRDRGGRRRRGRRRVARARGCRSRGIRLRVLRRASGRHHDAGAGPPALRVVRHDGAHRPRRPRLAAPGLVVCRVAHDAGARGERDRRGRRIARGAARRHRRGAGPARASGLTITFGFGPTLFEIGRRRPLRHRRSRAAASLERLPAFLGDDLDPDAVRRRPVHPGVRRRPAGRRPRDPQPQPHRLRPRAAALVAARLRPHVAHDVGAGRPRATSSASRTARRTSSPTTPRRSTSTCGSAASDQPAWMAGGSYLVARKIAMLIETWDRVRLSEQNAIIGRDKGEGAPLSGGDEFTEPDFAATDAGGRAAHPGRRVTCASRIPTPTAAPGSCVAATTSSTATTTSAGSMPGCSSCRTSARPSSSSGCSGRCRPTS